MLIAYNILLIVGVIVAVVFSGIVFVTGKGDAMSSGGSGIRTTFKGKASIEDQISRVTLILGCSFMGVMLIMDWLGANGAFK
jgi:preprotein translocase subunit SecG